MKQSERVEVIQRLYPRFNKQLDSCVTHGEETGVRLRADAAAAINRAQGKKLISERYINISARVDREFLDYDAFKNALRLCGYTSTAAWINICIKRLFCEAAARQKKCRGKIPTAQKQEENYSIHE